MQYDRILLIFVYSPCFLHLVLTCKKFAVSIAQLRLILRDDVTRNGGDENTANLQSGLCKHRCATISTAPHHHVTIKSPYFISIRCVSPLLLILAFLFVSFVLLAHGKNSSILGASLLLPGFGPFHVVSESRQAHFKTMQFLNKILLRLVFLIPRRFMARSWLDHARKPSVDAHYSFHERKPRFPKHSPFQCRHLLFLTGIVAFFIFIFSLHVRRHGPRLVFGN